MIRSYLPAIIFLLLGGLIGTLMVVLNNVFGPRRPLKAKSDPYECGLPSEVQSSFKFGVSFYLVAMLFILFDLEIVFMYPWAVVYKESIVQSKAILWSMLSFVTVLMVGYVYALKKGALDWKK